MKDDLTLGEEREIHGKNTDVYNDQRSEKGVLVAVLSGEQVAYVRFLCRSLRIDSVSYF